MGLALRSLWLCALALCAGALAQLTGDSTCVPSMCISATSNGSVVEFVMQSKRANIGWMAMGFGQQMINTPMIIMWPNANGSITLSHRQAGAKVMPTVVRSPQRVANISTVASSLTGSHPTLAFTVLVNKTNQDDLNARNTYIYALSSQNPGSSAIDATIQQHDGHGIFMLDLSKPLGSFGSDSNSTAGSGSDTGSDNGSSTDDGSGDTTPLPSSASFIPWSAYEKLAIAHGVVCSLGFLVLLPLGALLARYARTLTPKWFPGHWIIQFTLTAPIILAGIALGVVAINKSNGRHLDDTHKKTGLVLFVLYTAQCTLGALVHFLKPLLSTRRPPQNYAHGLLGLVLVALAFWQVRTGYHAEWPHATGRGTSNGVNIAWIVWAVMVPVLYFAGLALLPRQLRLEKANRRPSDVPLNQYIRAGQTEKEVF